MLAGITTLPVLEARDVRIGFGSRRAIVRDVSLSLAPGAALGLIGGSGSGKTTLARALVGLAPLSGGEVRIMGEQAFTSRRRPQPARVARTAQMVFQDPAGSLNPRKSVWWSVTEPAALLLGLGGAQRRALAESLFRRVGLDPAWLDRRPPAFSGGQRQRLAIARALSVEPKALILDEPTSALDLSVQAQVLNALLELNQAGVALLLITHDIAVVRRLCTDVAVMLAGEIVERGPCADVLANPAHPFTRQLVESSA